MNFYPFHDSQLIKNQAKYNGKQTLQRRFLYLFLLYLGASILSTFITSVVIFFLADEQIYALSLSYLRGEITNLEYSDAIYALSAEVASLPPVMLASLFCTGFTAAAILIYALVIEKRSAAAFALGGSPKNIVFSWLLGSIGGGVAMSLVVFACQALGAVTITNSLGIWWKILPYFFAFLIQAFSEEIFFRGYVLTLFLRTKVNVWWACIISAALFALLHSSNAGISILAICNLFLFGLVLAFLTLRTGNLWAATAIHALWNFVQGNVFGISVSGNPLLPSLWNVVLVPERQLTHGGNFGLEGGCITTLLLLLSLLAVIYIPKKNRDKSPTQE